jgi:DUF1680 family protein
MRLSFLVGLVAVGWLPAAAMGQAPAEGRAAVVAAVGLVDAKWTSGFWAERVAVCRSKTIPALGEIMAGTGRNQFLDNFRVAAGLTEGKHVGPPWNDGDLYKWIEAAAAVLATSPDPALDRRLDEVIAVVAKAQRADGYLHTPVLVANRNGDSAAKPFKDRTSFEMYNSGHLFTAAAVHHAATGKKSLLAVATKAADYLIRELDRGNPDLARCAVCPSHYMGAVDLYRATDDERYKKLAVRFLDLRDRVTDGTDDNQDRIPFRNQTEAVGHAVRANYLYAGAADVYAETGDKTLFAPLEKIWANVVGRKMYPTGACGALYDGASPDGAKDQTSIGRVHQAYGRDYQLPNSTAHNETCAAVGNVLWNERMLRATGDAKYGDVLETALLNAVLAGVSLDGTRYFYTNTLRQLDPMPAKFRWSREREAWINCFCCPPNVARTVAESAKLAYGRSDRGVWVHLYGAGTLDTSLADGSHVKLTQSTRYPWDGRIAITVETAPVGEMSLFVRVPGWADGATLAVNGRGMDAKSGRYAEVRRTWAKGDVLDLTLPMNTRLLEAHPLVEEARNQVAVTRGPLVYCLESTDLPDLVRIQSIVVPAATKFTPRVEEKDHLGVVVVLKAQAQVVYDREWGSELYREFRPVEPEPVSVTLVPYYAWANRGKSEMTVWLPLKR